MKFSSKKLYMKYLYIVLLFVLGSCREVPEVLSKTEIDLIGAIESSSRDRLENYCERLSYVKLETRDSVLLKYPHFSFTDHSIVAYEDYSLYQFSYDGSFVAIAIRDKALKILWLLMKYCGMKPEKNSM